MTADQFQAMRDTAKGSLDNSLGDQAKQINEDVKTPLEKYSDQVANRQIRSVHHTRAIAI